MATPEVELVLRPLCAEDTNAAWELTRRTDNGALLCPSRERTGTACREHRGTGALYRGELIAMCTHSWPRITATLGVRQKSYAVNVTMMGHLLVERHFSKRGIATRIGLMDIGLAYGTSDGPFPVVVAASFLDERGAIAVQKRAGMVQIPQNTHLLECDQALHAVDELAWKTKGEAGIHRAHSIQFLPMRSLPKIAKRLMTMAAPQGFYDERYGIRYRFHDPSPWSTLAAVWADVANLGESARKRLYFSSEGRSIIHVWSEIA